MYESDSTLSHQAADVAVAELVSDVPSDGLDYEKMIKVAAFEERGNVRKGLGHANDYPCSLAFAPEPGFSLDDPVVAAPQRGDGVIVGLRDCSPLRCAVGARRGDARDSDITDHPSFVPSGLVVDHKQSGEIHKDIDECSGVFRIGRLRTAANYNIPLINLIGIKTSILLYLIDNLSLTQCISDI